MVAHTITIPDWLELILSAPILLCRKLRYGYTFRLIPTTNKKLYAIVSPCGYPAMMRCKWTVRQSRTAHYASFFRKINSRSKAFNMHNLIMNPPAGLFVDHINGNSLDNRRENIRLATPAENTRNCRAKINGISKFKGVSPEKRRNCWRATITINFKQFHLGQFKSEIDAAVAYDKAAMKYHGKFARLNFPQKNPSGGNS